METSSSPVVVYRPIPFTIGFLYPVYLALETPAERPDGRPVPAAVARMRARRAAKDVDALPTVRRAS